MSADGGDGASIEAGAAQAVAPDLTLVKHEMDAEEYDTTQPEQERAPTPDLSLVKVEIHEGFEESTEVMEQAWQPWSSVGPEVAVLTAEAGAKELDPLLHADPPPTPWYKEPFTCAEEESPAAQGASSYSATCGEITIKIEKEDISDQSWKLYSSTVVLRDCAAELQQSGRYCQQCRVLFPSWSALVLHNTSASTLLAGMINETKKFKCEQCEYRTAISSHFKRHMRTHSGEKPFTCDQCEYRAAQRIHLVIHMSNHTGEKPFRCNQCEYKTAIGSHLKLHMKCHTGEKPLKCDQCDYRTAVSSHLRRHMKAHTGEKPFKCDQCEYRTGISSHLKRHMKAHTGEKPFKCDHCEYRTAISSHLKRHMKGHTGEQPFKCHQCEYGSARSTDIIRHMSTHMVK